MKTIPYAIVKNDSGTYAAIENPESEEYGASPLSGLKVIRSPFNSEDEAIQRVNDIAEVNGYKVKLIEVPIN